MRRYTSDDSHGRLPAFPFPLAATSKYSELTPWFVAYEMGPKLVEYSVEPPLWFCPARPYGYDRALRFIGALPTGSQTLDLTNLVLYWKTQSPEFAVIEHSWWVPRPLVGSPFSYPDPRVLHSRSEEGWPTRTEDPTGTFQPILTDGVFGVWNDTKTGFDAFGLGHEFPRFPFGRMRSVNCLFVDGRVETRPRSALRWQADFGHSAALVY